MMCAQGICSCTSQDSNTSWPQEAQNLFTPTSVGPRWRPNTCSTNPRVARGSTLHRRQTGQHQMRPILTQHRSAWDFQIPSKQPQPSSLYNAGLASTSKQARSDHDTHTHTHKSIDSLGHRICAANALDVNHGKQVTCKHRPTEIYLILQTQSLN